jgi:hypothetical protein
MASPLKRKLKTFLNSPLSSVRLKLIQILHRLMELWGWIRLRRHVSLEFLKKRPPGAFRPDYADLWFLYRLIRKKKPRCILELGGGCSTVVLAAALRQNYLEATDIKGQLYSLDVEEFWVQVTEKTLPPDLRPYCEISYTPALEIEY